MRRMRLSGTHFNIIGRTRLWLTISGVVVLVSLGSLAFRGINAGLEFRGGTAFQVESKASNVKVPDVDSALAKVGIPEATIQKVGARGFLIETKHLSVSQQAKTISAISSLLHVKDNEVNVTDVGPKWGAQITSKAVRALVIFLIVVVLYLSIRLEPKMAGAGMIALFHDMAITIGIYSILGFEVTPSTVIALLTILGYSLYDTVVIFDRVKERTANLSAAGRVTYSQAANEALNHVLLRSLNTSMTALLPVGSLLFVGSLLLGAQTLRELALALFVGIAAGTYSSVFVATPVLALWKERENRWSTLRTRVAARGQDAPPPLTRQAPSVAAAAPAPAAGSAVAVAEGASDNAPRPKPKSGPPPRRRKKKKKRRR